MQLTMEIFNVVSINDDAVVQEMWSFSTAAAAENKFIELLRHERQVNLPDPQELDRILEDGYFEIDGSVGSVCLSSTTLDANPE